MLPNTLHITLHNTSFTVWIGDRWKEFAYGPNPSQTGIELAVMYTLHR